MTSPKHRCTVTHFVSFPFLTRLNRALPARSNNCTLQHACALKADPHAQTYGGGSSPRGSFGSDSQACWVFFFFLLSPRFVLFLLDFLNESLRRWRKTRTVALAVLAPTVIRRARLGHDQCQRAIHPLQSLASSLLLTLEAFTRKVGLRTEQSL